ncbi:hypothetical protein ACO0LD_26535 [Undibacterium sp. Ji83W]|uniref:hypothetical protein n=1 Tax=Undibacterium sp. Ji83W TaxID=3413043 RepID=UPI003BF1FF4E
MQVRHCLSIISIALCCLTLPSEAEITKSITTVASKSKLSKDQVLQIARFAVKKHGLKLDSFQDPEVHFELVRKDQSWTVFFMDKTMAVDGGCMVIIDDNTGRFQLVIGH